MPTMKKRINVTLDKDTERGIYYLAKLRKQPRSAVIAALTRDALELIEDVGLAKMAEERMKNHKGKWLSHEEVWGK